MVAADIDGLALQSLTSYRAVSPAFDLTVLQNPYGIPPGPTHAAADGFWIILKPLSRGTHTIHFTGTVPFPELNFTFFSDQTVHLSVQPSELEDGKPVPDGRRPSLGPAAA
jgi:hypothetical protein